MNNEEIKSEEKVCYNCVHLCWAIGIGQGIRCVHPKKEIKFEIIPSRRHTCELFEINPKIKKEKI